MSGAKRAVRRLLSAWLVLLGCCAASCGGPPGPRWIELARSAVGGTLPVGAAGAGTRVVGEGEDLWLVAPLEREDWRALPESGRFRAGLALLAVGSPRAGGAPYRLVAGERAFDYEADLERFGRTSGRFTTNAAQALSLELCLARGEEPPARAELWACLRFQERESGALRVGGRRLSGAGIWVPSGHPRTLTLALPPDSRLAFATAVEPLFGGREARTAPHTFRVRLDGALLFEHRTKAEVLGESLAWHAVDLPRGGVQRAELEFEVEGPLALTSFLAPLIGPREFGSYGARPFGGREGRPADGARADGVRKDGVRKDIVVFLADTFRADNLAAYGNTLGLTPELDRFASRARTFTRVWSTSTHTLPAHSSMFSGVYPHENGQVDFDNPLPGAVQTLAELLAEQGYRCGLISDGLMVSNAHGLGQGFAIVDERRESGTLERARAFLDADDGRPLFLFVQTYAAHAPYTMTAETRARWGGVLQLDQSFEELMASELLRSSELLPLGQEAPPADPAALALARRLHDLYRAGVADLDALFGRFHAELEQHALLAHGVLLFTSDHGESFFEHGRPFHTNWVYEEELRVPLILAGSGLAAGREERRVSLIDFAPTLADLAGLEAPGHWRGRSILAPGEERVLYAFQARRARAGSTLAVIDGTRKLIGYEDLDAVRAGTLHAAFDLSKDPSERSSLHASASWPGELALAQRSRLEELLTPRVEQERVQLAPDELQELRDMGYAGEAPDK